MAHVEPGDAQEEMEGRRNQSKTAEELLAMGGKFYELCGQPWCDTAVDSWVFNSTTRRYERYEG